MYSIGLNNYDSGLTKFNGGLVDIVYFVLPMLRVHHIDKKRLSLYFGGFCRLK